MVIDEVRKLASLVKGKSISAVIVPGNNNFHNKLAHTAALYFRVDRES